MTTNDPQNCKIKIVEQNRRETNFEKTLFEIGFSYNFDLQFCLRMIFISAPSAEHHGVHSPTPQSM